MDAATQPNTLRWFAADKKRPGCRKAGFTRQSPAPRMHLDHPIIRPLVYVMALLSGWMISAHAAPLTFQIAPELNGRPLTLNSTDSTNAVGQTISISRFDWLMSEFRLRQRNGKWLDGGDHVAFQSIGKGLTNFSLPAPPPGQYDRLSFRIGLNPQFNAADPTDFGPEHALNPILNGLHWSWQGGYVFLAIEGRWRDEKGSGSFSYHLGNDHMEMRIDLPLELTLPTSDTLQITVNVDELLGGKPALRIGRDTTATHGRMGDPLAELLQTNTGKAFASVQSRKPTSTRLNTIPSNVLIGPHATPYRFTYGRHLPRPRLPIDNPLTEEGVELGRRLFHDVQLSVNGRQSCASCHQAEAGFVDANKAVSKGAKGAIGSRNSMPLFNLAWKDSFFWDGRAPSLRAQVLMPIQSEIEMHESLPRVQAKLTKAGYGIQFEQAFGSRRIDSDRIARALEQFLLTIVSYTSRFDQAVRGETQLSETEKKGFYLFMTEYDPRRGLKGADCFHCHGGPLFGNNGFANNGLDTSFPDLGLATHTGREHDKGRFSVPSLRNVALTAPYMHDGRFETLEEVITHYASGVKRSPTLDPNLAKHARHGIELSAADQKALVAFLKTLTDPNLASRGLREQQTDSKR